MSCLQSTPRTNMLLLLAAAVMFTSVTLVSSHGRLMDPPARNSMWRLGFANPVNYNDNELYCGGRVTQWARNKGKCGVCGDPYHNVIKEHEVGGKYAKGIISREYTQGGNIEIIVHITANHKGYFEFRICPVEDPKVEVTQECLDTHVLPMANGEGSRYFLPEGKSNQFFNVSVQLPEDVTCKQCVVQWKYRTGNTWDKDESGKFCVGCGPQEEFYNCADVTINPRGSNVNGQQKGNAKPVIPESGGKSRHTVDGLRKKEDAGSDDKSDNLKKSPVDDTISDYGKQKVHFIQKLENNKYSSWGEPKSTDVKYTNRSPFAHLARKGSDGSAMDISSTMKSGQNGGGFLSQSPVTRTQTDQLSGGVRWKTGISDNSQVDRIRRRFGYSSSLARENHSNNSFVGNQGKTTQQFHNISSNRITTSVGNNKHDHTSPYLTTSHGSRITMTPSHSRSTDVTAIPLGDTKFKTKDITDAHRSLQDVINSVRTNQKERGNFLQNWKLQKLGRIAALRALRSMHVQGGNKGKYWHTTLASNSVTPPIMRMKRLQAGNSTTPKAVFTLSPQQTQGFVQQRMGSNIQSSVADAYTKSPKSQLDKKHSYARNQLPAWLVKALKFKERQADNGYKTGKKNNIGNFNKENRYQVVTGYANNELKKSFVRPQMTESSHDYSNLLSTKTGTDSNHNTRHQQKSVRTQLAEMRKVHRNYDRNGVHKLSEEDVSDLSNKSIQDGDNIGTESLVRYIVSLLISQMKNDDSNEYNRNFETRNQSMFGDIFLSTVTPLNTVVHDTTSRGYTWFVPGPNSASTTKNIPDSRRIIDNKKTRAHTGTVYHTQADLHHHSQRKQNNLPPSVRGEVRAFNGLILGSDYGNNQRLSRNLVDKYHNWRTAQRVDSTDEVNAEGINTQGSHGTDNKINIANIENNNNKYNSRPDNKEMRHDTQSYEMWLQSQAQAPAETPTDPHHQWSVRAGKRQDHYNRPQDIPRSQLVCESLVVLSGGMDRWCTDNCNANFCPSSLCVCTVSTPASPSRLLNIPFAIPRQQRRTLPRQHSGAFPRQHSSAVTNGGFMERFYKTIDMNSRSDRYPPATRTVNTKSPQYSAGNNERSNEKLYRNTMITQTPTMKNLHSISHKSNKDNMSLFLANLIGQGHNSLNSRAGNIDSFSSTKTVPNYSLHSSSTTENQNIPYTFNGDRLGGFRSPFNNYHIKDNHFQLPQTARNDTNGRFQMLHQIPELPQRLNWHTNANSYNLRQTNIPLMEADNSGSRTRVMLQPYTSYNHILSHAVPANDAFSNSGVYSIRGTAGENYFGQKSFYSQTPVVKPEVSVRAAHPRLVCKALGAFAGVSHFDEWCLSTCLTTVCPLTVCSCEQPPAARKLVSVK